MRELDLFEEACGEFHGYRLDGERIVVAFKDSCSIVLPRSAQEALKLLKAGQRVAIVKVTEDCVKVRRV